MGTRAATALTVALESQTVRREMPKCALARQSPQPLDLQPHLDPLPLDRELGVYSERTPSTQRVHDSSSFELTVLVYTISATGPYRVMRYAGSREAHSQDSNYASREGKFSTS